MRLMQRWGCLTLASLSENEASLIELTYSMQVMNINLLGECSALWGEREGGKYLFKNAYIFREDFCPSEVLIVGRGNETLLWSVPFPPSYISHKNSLIPKSSPPPTVSLQAENAWGRCYIGLASNQGFLFRILSRSSDFSPKLWDKYGTESPSSRVI